MSRAFFFSRVGRKGLMGGCRLRMLTSYDFRLFIPQVTTYVLPVASNDLS